MKIIKAILLILTFVLLGLVLWGCNDGTPAEQAERWAQERGRNSERLDDILNGLVYGKDPKTGICFAFAWFGNGEGGPAFSYVPCTLLSEEPSYATVPTCPALRPTLALRPTPCE